MTCAFGITLHKGHQNYFSTKFPFSSIFPVFKSLPILPKNGVSQVQMVTLTSQSYAMKTAFVLLAKDDRAHPRPRLNVFSIDLHCLGAAVLFSFSYSLLPSTAPHTWLQSTACPPSQHLAKFKIRAPTTMTLKTTPFFQQVRKRQYQIRLKRFQSETSLISFLTKCRRSLRLQLIIIIRRRRIRRS